MLNKIVDAITKTEYCSIVDPKGNRNKAIHSFESVIKVETEITFESKCLELILYVAFTNNLTLYLPKVFIDERSYEALKYIPHINGDLSICIFDETKNFTFNLDDLPDIVLDLISRAKGIIKQKENKSIILSEFEREFYAYWNIEYCKEDKINVGLALIDYSNFDQLRAIRLTNKIGVFEYLVYNKENDFEAIKNYLEFRKIQFKTIPVYIADPKVSEPPFNIGIKESLCYLSEKERFKKEINKYAARDFLVVFKNNQNELYGWLYPTLHNNIKGFRSQSQWQYLNSNIPGNKCVERITFSNISKERLDIRTSGTIIERSLSISITGLGSVGSNLLHYISKFPVKKYELVDNDILAIENVFRHDFGINYLSKYKTLICKNELLSKNPFIEVKTHEKKIDVVLNNHPDFFNEHDFNFLIVGNSRVEVYVLEHLINRGCKKPIFIIWVEPYLASGQVLFVLPEQFLQALNLIKEYPYHVLASSPLNDATTYLKEGSCQTGYFPYSETYLTLFLSALIDKLYNFLLDKKFEKDSQILSWIGDISYLKSIGLNINPGFNESETFKLVVRNF